MGYKHEILKFQQLENNYFKETPNSNIPHICKNGWDIIGSLRGLDGHQKVQSLGYKRWDSSTFKL